MKNLLRILAAVAFGVWLVILYRSKFGHDNSHQPITDVLVVGTNAEFPPFALIDNNEIVGFDIDLAREITKRMNKKMVIKDMPFESLLPALQFGEIQMIAAGMTPTPERAQHIAFTKPFITGDRLVVLTLKNNPITHMDHLTDKEVVVNDGFTADFYMSKIQGPNLRRLPTPAEALLALRNGNVFAYVSAYNAIKPFLEKYGTDQFNIFPIEGTNESSAFAVAKEQQELLTHLNTLLDELERDGTIEQLKKKWHVS